MKVQVLGNFGSRSPGHYTTALLLNDTFAVDAGTVALMLPIDQQARVDDVLLTHAHLDHVADLPFLVDNVFVSRSTPIRVWGPPQVLDVVHKHFFNNQVYPDFTVIPPGKPAIRLCPLVAGEVAEIAGLKIAWVEMNHTVYAAGYCISDGDATILVSGDTTTTEALWRMGRTAVNLKLAFVETSFPNDMAALATLSGHLTPALLKEELAKLDRPEVPALISHIKPQFREQIHRELHELGLPQVSILTGGEEFNL
ncbi:MAG: 3',5'-cyclic-nucleotide phosphodiesterase [Desulfuromonadales bacterium]|nr:3',5'-cyclic-nucleotide phosphodiesterase [Desulfuromonadales bacterium]